MWSDKFAENISVASRNTSKWSRGSFLAPGEYRATRVASATVAILIVLNDNGFRFYLAHGIRYLEG